jgi:hypothetical protein
MQQTFRSIKKIKESLKQSSAVLLLALSMTGCMSAPVQRKTEIWFIDKDTTSLYRTISDTRELAIPITNNPDMSKFMCVSKDEFKDIVEDAVDAK